jgi:hypothetical protein
MKKLLLIFMWLTAAMASRAQTPKVDSVAVMILDHMSDVIGELNSCSFKLTASEDVSDYDFGTIKRLEYDDVHIVG